MMKILNRDLFDDQRDYEIARLISVINDLKKEIEAFKTYDKERKEYYAKVIEDNTRMREQLKSGGKAMG